MARNRKVQSAANRFGPALKAILLCLLIGGSGVGYVWQKDQIDRLGKQMQERQTRLDKLKRDNIDLRDKLAKLQSPPWLDRRVKELNLGLGPPQPAYVWRLTEPTRESASKPERDRQFAARGGPVLEAP